MKPGFLKYPCKKPQRGILSFPLEATPISSILR
jgi:hypothetical protein